MRLFAGRMDPVGKYIMKKLLKASGLNIFLRYGCDASRDGQRVATYSSISAFLRSLAMFSYAIGSCRLGDM